MDEQKKNTRRRGEVLEEAILQAAWAELSQIGYNHLTMESIATRAETNKAVLYRRWKNKTELVMAAVRRYLPKFSNEIPDTGSLRSDMFAYLHEIARPIQSIGTQTIRGLMMEPLMQNSIIASIPHIIQPRPENKVTIAITAILKNAELRREARLDKLTARIIALPWELLRSEMIMKQEVSDETIAEIIDDIFLPLVRLNNQPSEK